MVKENEIIKRNYWTYAWPMFLEPKLCVCLKMSVIYIYKCHIFFCNDRVFRPFIQICLFSLG